MKMRYLIVLLAASCLYIFSCKEEVDEYIIVKLSPAFINVAENDDTPMKIKSEQTSDTSTPIYAIQIFENDSAYYYGLFDDVSKMEIALSTSKTYKFKVTAIKNGTGNGLRTTVDTSGVNYFFPNKIPLKNKFIKGSLLRNINHTTSIITFGEQKEYSEIDVFYATKTVSIDKGTTNIDFTLLRMGFGINFNVDGLSTGYVEVYIGDDTIKLNSTNTSAYTIRQFSFSNDFDEIHSNESTFGDSISINVNWIGTNGTTVNAKGKYRFSRNYQKDININLNSLKNGVYLEEWGFPIDGLVGWWPFNGNANDESGNGNHGIVDGAILTNDRFGKEQSAYSFDGNDFITCSPELPINNNPRAFSFWIKTKDVGSMSIITYGKVTPGQKFSIQSSNQYPPSLTYNHIYVSCEFNDIYSSTQISTDVWTHILVNYNTNKLQVFINNQLNIELNKFNYFTNSLVSSINTVLSKLYIGTSIQDEWFKGKIDDIGIWNRALTNEEISKLYNFVP
jgi:hypothetical protein